MNDRFQKFLITGGIIVVVLLLIVTFLGTRIGWHMNDFGMMRGIRWRGGYGMMIMPLLWIVIIGLGIWAVMVFLKSDRSSQSNKERTPLEILKERYARGEIDKEEFEAKKRDLE